ncbi:PepSY domain-containing protein [Jannaschia sp. R86511]|uniref:PepSY domain-containing protein n=1 Tax=Jannaschia sp. R86511 TaxID=3093853 RepID=UPI0036D237D6
MRTAPLVVAAAVAGVVAVGVAAAVASDGDEVRQIEAVSVGDVTVDDTAATGTPTAEATGGPTATDGPTDDATTGSRQVEGLDEVRGVLTRDDDSDDDSDSDDRDELEVAGVDLELGPEGWLLGAGPVADFDGDGTLDPALQELEGLLGQEVVVLGRLDSDDDDLEVYELQGLTFRDSAGAPAPWQSGDDAPALTRDGIAEAALDAVGEGSRLDSVDREDDGGAAWEVEVHDAQGREQRVLLDEAGTVLDIRQDD